MAAPSARALDLEPKDPAALAVKRIADERARRRESAEGRKNQRNMELAKNEGLGDLDFGRMIAQFRASAPEPRKHDAPGDHDICCVVRKRPINARELKMKDWDCVTTVNPRVVVHAPKLKVDGITKYLDNLTFEFDHVSRHRTLRFRVFSPPLRAWSCGAHCLSRLLLLDAGV
jgi:kinesin family member 2/24